MDNYTVKRLWLILAIQAEVEGMKAENEQRKVRGESMAYTETDFNDKSMEIRNVVYCADELL